MKLFQSNKRPCECGCKFNDHAKIQVTSREASFMAYCRKCSKDGIDWCYSYRPCKNLEYLEWLSK